MSRALSLREVELRSLEFRAFWFCLIPGAQSEMANDG